jgi:hypothetical protein
MLLRMKYPAEVTLLSKVRIQKIQKAKATTFALGVCCMGLLLGQWSSVQHMGRESSNSFSSMWLKT